MGRADLDRTRVVVLLDGREEAGTIGNTVASLDKYTVCDAAERGRERWVGLEYYGTDGGWIETRRLPLVWLSVKIYTWSWLYCESSD